MGGRFAYEGLRQREAVMRLRTYLRKSCRGPHFRARRLCGRATLFVASLAVVVAGDGAWAAGTTARPNAPNVVFILADDKY